VLICTPSDVEWLEYSETELKTPSDFEFSGARRFVFPPLLSKKEFDNVFQRINCFTNGTLIFDDCRMYFQAREDHNAKIRLLVGRKRQKMIDIYAVGHGFTEVPPMFFTFATDIIMFKTTDDITRRKNCIKDFNATVRLQTEVNTKAQKQPHFCKHFKFS
jgi:hypothetical protein